MISVLSCLYLFPLLFLLSFPPLTDPAYMLSRVCLFATPGIIAHQAPLFMGLSKQESEWVARPSSRGSSWPRDWTGVSSGSCVAGGFFACWAMLSPLSLLVSLPNLQTLLATLMVPSWRIPLGRRKLFSLCSGDIRLHFVWVIYILEHTCVFHVEFKNPTEHLPLEPNWHLFPAFWRGFWAWGWGTSPTWQHLDLKEFSAERSVPDLPDY